VLGALLCLALPGYALAQAQPLQPVQPVETPIELRFDIDRYTVEGNTLLTQPDVDAIVQPFAGRQRDFGDVQRALEALENAYRARGYSAVQVYLPEQDLEKGDVRLRVIEARIRRMEIKGNKFFDEPNIRASLPALAEGKTPNANEVSKNLRIVNESPAKQTSVTLRAGEKEGEVDAVVDVADEDPRKYFVTLDNTGSGSTGNHRIGFGLQNSNLFGRDHAITVQYVTSVEKPKTVGVYSVGYHIPLYGLGASMDFIAGYSNVDAGTTQTPTGELKFSGTGSVFGFRYNQQLDRIGTYEHKLVVAIDYRDYRNNCTLGTFGAAGCGTAAATFSLTPVWLTYAGTFNQPRGAFGYYLTAASNLALGQRGETDDIGRARFEAKANYMVYRGGANFAHAFESDWQLRARFEAQYTNEVLVSPEHFGIGGMNSVRGFLERERADDRGYSGSIEAYTPEIASKFGWDGWNLRMLGFYDYGRTSRVHPQPGEVVHNGFASWGIGTRVSYEKRFTLRMDLAQILDPGGSRQRNHWRAGFSSLLAF
jgi:hemolysin activation/secretion protein